MANYLCVQFGVCPRADSGECINVGSDFKCGRDPEDPDCVSKLEPTSEKAAGTSRGLKIGLAVATLVMLGAVGYFVFDSHSPAPASAVTAEQLLKQVWPWLGD